MNSGDEIISSDLPVTDPSNDELRYAPFAEKLARSILRIPAPEGYVIAINGEWGLGKSTVIAFILHYLGQEPADRQPLIFEFSPWMFSGHEDLTRRFCEQLYAKLTSDARWKTVARSIKRPIGNLANTLSDAPFVGQYAKTASKLLDNKPDVHNLKKAISEELAKETRKIVVVIDDIDRLSPEEMQHLFRVIKAVANFPNIIYLVVFDKAIVAKALSTSSMSGASYLEKIIQAPFDIPRPSRTLLEGLFIRKLNAVIGNIPDEQFDQSYWSSIYIEGIRHFIVTPRHIIRLLNALTVTIEMVRDEVNPIDFIALETLRLFCPEIYKILRSNKEMFTGYVYRGSGRDYQADEYKAFHNAWLQQLPEADRDPVKKILQRLFPKLQGVFGNTFYGAESSLRWRKDYRVCVAERFDVYFGFTLPDDMLSRAEVQAFVAKTENVQTLVEIFNELLKEETTRVEHIRTYLRQLDEQIHETVPLENISNVVVALFTVGDKLIAADKKQGIFDLDNESR